MIPLVARHRPLRHLVFLCTLVPEPGRSVTDRYTTDEVYVPGFVGNTRLRDDGASYWPDPEARHPVLLPRLHGRGRKRAPSPGCDPSRQRHDSSRGPSTRSRTSSEPRSFCRDERVIAPAWSRTMSRELLGVEPIELDGGHSPFLSRPRARRRARPARLSPCSRVAREGYRDGVGVLTATAPGELWRAWSLDPLVLVGAAVAVGSSSRRAGGGSTCAGPTSPPGRAGRSSSPGSQSS